MKTSCRTCRLPHLSCRNGVAAQCSPLLNVFNDQMKDQLACREEPSSFEDLITLAIHIDNLLAEHRREMVSRSLQPSHRRSSHFMPSILPSSGPAQSVYSPPAEDPGPMQVGRARLTMSVSIAVPMGMTSPPAQCGQKTGGQNSE